MRKLATLLGGLVVLALLGSAFTMAAAKPLERVLLAFDPHTQSANLFMDEARAVYLGNLERRKAGQPPLRWNRELTLAARWFAWDSTINRAAGFCGHDDTQGHAPWDRMSAYGYLGFGGAENAYCGFMTPEAAIAGWMKSQGHHDNLLNSGWWEIGLGYYQRSSDGRGYITQDFGIDRVAPPLVIENEAPNTTNPQVNLYRYSPKDAGSLSAMGPAVQMETSASPCFAGSSWQPYKTETTFKLPGGQGWKTVYSKIRDKLGRTSTVSDTIYLGGSAPAGELNFSQLSQTNDAVKLYNLDGKGKPYAQFSLGWMVDDDSFQIYDFNANKWNPVGRVNDSAAWGGTAYHMTPSGENWAWAMTDASVPKGTPLVAYFRLKADAIPTGEMAKLIIKVDGQTDITRAVQGSEVKAAGKYQEFAVNFQLPANYTGGLTFNFSLSGSTPVSMDAISVFTGSQKFTSPTFTYQVPGKHYRGQGVWVRYADGKGNFTAFQEAATAASFSASPQSYSSMVQAGGASARSLIKVSTCGGSWSVSSAPNWLGYKQTSAGLEVWGNASGLALNGYQGNLVLQGSSPQETISIPVKLVVAAQIQKEYLAQVTQ